MNYVILFLEFFKIGLLAIGGGMASLPFLHEMVQKYGWITEDELINMIAVSEATPGPIGTNVATYVGYTIGGVPGALIATLSEVAPSVLIITLLARWLPTWSKNKIVQGGFAAVRPAVAGLIGAVALGLARSEFLRVDGWQLGTLLQNVDWAGLGIGAVLFLLLQRYDWHPVLVIVGAAAVGIVLGL